MPLLGRAAIAMWWDMQPERRREFEDWHSHEHLPERLAIPGFSRGSRWAAADDGPGFFVMYELAEYDTLTSPHYLARLNNPTPWSTRLMPHHRRMVRSQCRVVESAGAGVARHVLTLRFSPAADAGDRLRRFLGGRAEALAASAGTVGAHLLCTETPSAAITTEQQIRGMDGVADWIFVVAGYELEALRALRDDALSDAALALQGAESRIEDGLFSLSHALTAWEASA